MKQNKYDDPEFFSKYSQMPRSIGGLDSTPEWHAFRTLLPDLCGARVLDLGCGYGWHCRYARMQGAAKSVLGVDLSERMLECARQATSDPAIEYRRLAIEDFELADGVFNLVISSLALHYVERFDMACRKIFRCLVTGGAFVFSVEHPIFTAIEAQEWCCSPEGYRLHWPVDNYQEEGQRDTMWLSNNVVKYHRTVATYVNTLIDCGFGIQRVLEPVPPQEMIVKQPDTKDHFRRPQFLLIAARKSTPQ